MPVLKFIEGIEIDGNGDGLVKLHPPAFRKYREIVAKEFQGLPYLRHGYPSRKVIGIVRNKTVDLYLKLLRDVHELCSVPVQTLSFIKR